MYKLILGIIIYLIVGVVLSYILYKRNILENVWQAVTFSLLYPIIIALLIILSFYFITFGGSGGDDE